MIKDSQRKRLEDMLIEKKDKIKLLENFDLFFQQFIYEILRSALLEINMTMHNYTNQELKLFLDDPYSNGKHSRYFAMVKLLPGKRIERSFLDNSTDFPLITFEGNEITGEIFITTNLDIDIDDQIEINKLIVMLSFMIF